MPEDKRAVTRETLEQALAPYATKDDLAQVVETMAQQHESLVETIQTSYVRVVETVHTWRDGLVAMIETSHGKLVEMIQTSHGSLVEMIQTSVSASEKRLMVEIGRAARVAAEEHRRELGVLDDRYRDLPTRVSKLERDLDEHRQDAAAHGRPRRPRR
jgi:hypothetical protein